MATAPLAITGSAMASPLSPAPTDRDSTDWAGLDHSSSRSDSSDWDDDDNWDDDSPSFNRGDYAHAADDDSPSWRSDSANSDNANSDNDDSDDSDSASSSDDDSPRWNYAEPYSSRSDSDRSDSSRSDSDRSDSGRSHSARSSRYSDDDSLTPTRTHRQATPRASRELPSRRHSEPATPQATDAKWDKLAQCESTQNWDSNTGNGYKGGLQFDDRTWRNYGGTQYAPSADRASRDEQIAVAKKVQEEQGWHAWPGCSRKLGYA